MTVRWIGIGALTVAVTALLVLAGLDIWITVRDGIAARDPSAESVTGFGTGDPKGPLIAMQLAFVVFLLAAAVGAVCFARRDRRRH